MAWTVKSLGDVLTFQRGFDITKADQSPGPYWVISSSGPNSKHNQFKVKGPGVVIGRKGTLGTAFYSAADYWPHDTTLWVKDFHGNDPRFAYYFVQTMGFEKFDVGASNPTLNRNHIHVLPVRWPDSLTAQRRIASTLSAYDDLIENNMRRNAILEEMARRIYEEWFVRFRFPGHEGVRMVESELGLVPEGWQCGAFTDLADVLSGGTPKKAEPEFWGGTIPFFTPTDAPKTAYVLDTEAHITDAGLVRCASQLYPKDTVFITARGTVGKLALAASYMAMNQSCYALKSRSGYGQLFLYLATQAVVGELKAKSHGAVFDTIIMDTFRLMRVVKPPVELATRLESLVRPLFALSLTLSRNGANLRATRDLLLPKLISGELDVSALPEPEALAA